MSIQPRNGPRTVVKGAHTFLGAYFANKDACANAWSRNLNNNTQEQYEGIIINRIVPHLEKHDETPLYDYRKQDFINAIKSIQTSSKQSKGSASGGYAEDTLQKYYHIIKTVVKVASEKECFANVFDDDAEQESTALKKDKSKQFHLIPKSLSIRQEFLVCKYLFDRLLSQGESIALFLMFGLGLRDAEACGVNFGSVREMTEYPGNFYLIIPQTTIQRSNRLQPSGKTYNTARNIPLSPLAVRTISILREDRIRQLLTLGHTSPEIDNLPLAYRSGNPCIRCGANDVSAAGRQMFYNLGMRDILHEVSRYLKESVTAAQEEAVVEDEFVLIERDPTSYLLRRNFATHLTTLKLNDSEISYVIGHRIVDSQTKRSDFLDERELYAIKEKMDARPIFNHIDTSPVRFVEGNNTMTFDRYSQTITIPGSASMIQLSASAKEPTAEIRLTTRVSHTVKEDVSIHSVPFPHHFGQSTDVLSAYHKAYENYIAKHPDEDPNILLQHLAEQ